jgi:hypothetical protein
MTEDKFEDFLKKAAQGYNVPPVRTPRDEMWSAIQAKRAAGPRVVYGGGSLRQPSERRFGSRIWLGAAAAAVLLLATGVGLGRWSATNQAPGKVASADPHAANPQTANPQSANPQTAVPAGVATTDVSGANPGVIATGSATERSPTRARAIVPPRFEGQRENVRVASGTGGASASPGSGSSSAYQLTAVRHLSEAEALLTSFRTRTTADQQMDAQLGSWARELLSNTRLLLDSPVANDPQRRPLLEDLELVLVQIVQLSPGSSPQDRELIEKTLQQDHVMTRLRTAIPAGPQRGS